MLLDARLEGTIDVKGAKTSPTGAPYWETTLISDDGQSLFVYEGQLKETELEALEVGARYRVVFRPFVNNRWLELKIASVEPVPAD